IDWALGSGGKFDVHRRAILTRTRRARPPARKSGRAAARAAAPQLFSTATTLSSESSEATTARGAGATTRDDSTRAKDGCARATVAQLFDGVLDRLVGLAVDLGLDPVATLGPILGSRQVRGDLVLIRAGRVFDLLNLGVIRM